MQNWFLISGAILSFLGVILHGFIGGKMYGTNINKSDLEPLGKTLSMFSWQFHTIFQDIFSDPAPPELPSKQSGHGSSLLRLEPQN